jgi:hypothetical protein
MAHGKSPYELRADLLRLAFEILLAEHHAKDEKTYPTTEEVIAEARKLNEFISTQKTGSRG